MQGSLYWSLYILPLYLSTVFGDTKSCYWPDGTKAAATEDGAFVPCSTDGHSQCCASGEACLTNGLCFGAWIGSVYRGACTDSSWQASDCPKFCQTSEKWANLQSCGTEWDSKWWCSPTNNGTPCETSGNAEFNTYSRGYLERIVALSTTSSGTASATSTASSVASTPAGATTPASTSPNTCPDTESGTVNIFIPLGVGLGTGVPLAIIAIALAILYRRERKKRVEMDKHGHSTWTTYQPVTYPRTTEAPAPAEKDAMPVHTWHELPHRTPRAELYGYDGAPRR